MKYLTILFCLFFILNGFSQNASLTISDEIEIDKKKFEISNIMGSDGTHMYLKGRRKNKLTYAKMDNMFNIVKSVEVDLDAEIKGMELIDSRMVNNNIVLITELEQSKEGKINNYVWTLNTQTMEFDKPKMILEVSQKIIKESRLPFFDFDLTNQNYNDDRIVYYSEDNSKFAILASIPLSGKEKGRFNKRLLTVYDLSLNKLWSSELDMIQNHEFFVNIVTTLGNDGSFYSIGIAYNSVSEMKQKSNGIYTLRKFDNNGKGEDFSLNFGNKKIIQPKFSWSKNNLICAGFYSVIGANKKLTEGVAYIQMDNTGKIIKESVKEFSDQFVNSMRSVKKGSTVKDKGGDLGISNNFLIKDLKARPDGGAFLLAEEFNSFTISTSDGRGGRTYISTYIFGDKFVCGIDPNGQFEWLVNIPTNMIYDRPDIGTYVSFSSQDKLYLIYSDNEDNLKQKLNQRPIDNTKLKKVSTAIVSIDNKTGKAERKALIDSKDEKFLLLPTVSANINDELFILGGKFGMYQVKEYRIARISVK